MSKLTKEVAPSNEIVVKIGEVDVVIYKVSNVYKIGEEVKYLKQIVWEEATEAVLKEITEELQK